MVSCDFQHFRRMTEAVNLVQHDPFSAQGFEERFRVFHHAPHARQLAVKILDVRGFGREPFFRRAEPRITRGQNDAPMPVLSD